MKDSKHKIFSLHWVLNVAKFPRYKLVPNIDNKIWKNVNFKFSGTSNSIHFLVVQFNVNIS